MAQLAFFGEHQNWEIHHLVVFTDGSRFTLRKCDRRERVWRRLPEASFTMTGLEGLTDLSVVADITPTAEWNPETHYQTLLYVGTVRSDIAVCTNVTVSTEWWDQKRWNSNITRNLDFVFFFLANCKNKTSCSKFDCSWVSRGCLQIVLQQDFRNSSHTLKTSNSKMCCFKKCEHLWFCMNCMNFYVTEKDQVFCCLHSRMKRLLIIQFVQATIVPRQILRADLQLQFPGPNRYSRKTRDNGSCL